MVFSTYSYSFYTQLLYIFLASLSIKIAVSLWGHSGQGKPPMFGDFEAQRHWMEITVNLPASDWYKDTSDNDLQYWGLDYPPLTAYHMMINGKIAGYINPDFVALKTSRGLEDLTLKFFMRLTVLAMDLLLFLPTAVVFFMMTRSRDSSEKDVLVQITMLIGYPGLMLIDNGHFQYNNVSLSLCILAVLAFLNKNDNIGAFLFCLALNYKQMELYHALPFFSYLFGSLIQQEISKGISKFISLSTVVVVTFLALWLPFLGTTETAMSVLYRLFPVKRGLYEINAALIFFLFSYHVHEKTILLAVIPAILVLKYEPFFVVWFMLISVFSMLPLLIKDGLLLPSIATVGIFWIICTHYSQPTKNIPEELKLVFSLLAACCIALATVFVPPPSMLPDLFSLLIAIFSCGHFCLFTVVFHLKQFGIDIYNQSEPRDIKRRPYHK